MHFAYPPRKSSNPPPYMRAAAKLPGLRRSRLKTIAIVGFAFIFLVWLFNRPSSSQGPYKGHVPSGKPPVVLVTVLDEKGYDKAYLDVIRENRIQYAEKHGRMAPWLDVEAEF